MNDWILSTTHSEQHCDLGACPPNRCRKNGSSISLKLSIAKSHEWQMTKQTWKACFPIREISLKVLSKSNAVPQCLHSHGTEPELDHLTSFNLWESLKGFLTSSILIWANLLVNRQMTVYILLWYVRSPQL